MEDIKEYLATEFIEEYEDGALDRLSLERRLVGILGPDRAARLLEDVSGLPARTRPQPSARAPIMRARDRPSPRCASRSRTQRS